MAEQSLDDIMSGRSEDSPAPETNEQQVAHQQPEPQQPQGDDGEGDQPQQTGMVPHAALHAEKQKVKRYTEQIASFEQKIADNDARWEQRFNQILQSVNRPQPQPTPPKQERPDLYENPEGFVQSAVEPKFQEYEKVMLHNARLVANSVCGGTEVVNAAEQAFLQAMQSGQLDEADYHRVVGSPNRYAAAVDWHKRQSVFSETGGDLNSYRDKLLNDPDFLAKAAERLRASAQPGAAPNAAAQPPAVDPSQIPSSFGGRNAGPSNAPTWNGPRPLSEIKPN